MATLYAETMDMVEGRVGQVLRDKWQVESLIGVGGMAAVYAATHRNGNRVALKVLHQQLSVDANIRSRFTREGYVANMINHPGIVRVLDDDQTDEGSVFLVMDLLEGETADARAQRLGGRLPLEDVLLVADGLLDVMGAAHDAGIVHRDIKPENIFITVDREVKVLDFGIARLRDGFTSAVKTSAMMGTPAFMPPEQALGRMEEVDALSDVWAVGATMFNLISGQLVHEAETPNELLILAATAPARSLSEVARDVPLALVEVVDRALAVEKAKRWSGARAMQHALRQVATEVLRAPLPPPVSLRVKTAPRAFKPFTPKAFKPVSSPYDDTLAEGELPPVSERALSPAGPPVRGGSPAAMDVPLLPVHEEPSTFDGAAAPTAHGSGRRVLTLAAVASLVVLVGGAIGVGLAMRSVKAPVPAATATPVVVPSPEPAAAARAEPAAAPTPTEEIAAEVPSGEPAGERKAPPAGRAQQKKSWLDRRK